MKHLISVLMVSLFLVGCASTPTGDVEAFAEATLGVTEKVNNVIMEYNDNKVKNELNKLAQHKKRISVKKLEPVKNVLINSADKKKYALYKANIALGKYARALSELAKSNSRTEIDLAASNLYGSLYNFNEQYKTLKGTDFDLVSNEDSAALGKIIASIGSAYIEKKRAEAIKAIVIKANPFVESICDVIIDEFLKGVIETRLYTMKNTDLSGYIKEYNSTVANASYSDKKNALDTIYKKYLKMQSSSASIKQAIKAITTVKETHAILKKAVEKDNFTSKEIVKSIGKLKDIENHYDDLEVLMLSCETKIISTKDKGLICNDVL